jgi:trimeric autotransporter adhesin
MLDIKSSNKGLLIPRVNLLSDSDILTIANPRISLLVYNTNATLTYGDGYYFWNGTVWNKFATRSNLSNLAWNVDGNTGTNATTDFIGTSDNKPLVFKTNNILSGKIDPVPNNTFFGQSAGLNITNGNNNSFFGQNTGVSTTTGSGNLFVGHNAGTSNTAGSTNVFLGQGAGKNNTSGSKNIFIGEDAGFNSSSTFGNTAVGTNALYSNTNGTDNTTVGYQAMYSNTIGSFNNAYGYQALFSNINGDFNVAIGNKSLYFNTSGKVNTAVGYWSLFNNSIGWHNVGVGYGTLYRNTAGSNNVAIGAYALHDNTTGDYNAAFGDSAMFNNTTGYQNSAFGYDALQSNKTGFYNAAFGRTALYNNTNGDRNAAFGVDALRENVSGFQNTACGNSALKENLVGDYNSALGYFSGPDVGLTSLNNTTAIGYNAKVSTSNTMAFGDAAVDRWAFGITTTNANHALEVGVNATDGNGAYLTQGGTWTNTSDMNKKEDFSEIIGNELLQKISQLSIQRWKYKGTNEYHIGPTAQEFYTLFNVGTDDKGISTVDPAGIALAAIKEQQRLIEKQNELILQLEKRIEVLERK